MQINVKIICVHTKLHHLIGKVIFVSCIIKTHSKNETTENKRSREGWYNHETLSEIPYIGPKS